jgi:hypothetical protein
MFQFVTEVAVFFVVWSGITGDLDPEDFYQPGQSLGLPVPPPMITTINYA